MAKRCALVNASLSDGNPVNDTDWTKCIFCQSVTDEALQCPAKSKRIDVGAGYSSLAEILPKYELLGCFPHTLRLSRLDEGAGILETLTSREARWHKSCRRLYYRDRLMLHQKRIESDETPDDSITESSRPKRVCTMHANSIIIRHPNA